MKHESQTIKMQNLGTYKHQAIVNSLRCVYLTYFLSVGCVQSFQSVLLKKIGLSNSQIGTVYTVGLIGGFISPLAMSAIADKLRKTRIILIFLSILTVAFHIAPVVLVSVVSMQQHLHQGQTQQQRFNSPRSLESSVNSSSSSSSSFASFVSFPVLAKPLDLKPSPSLIYALVALQFLLTFGDQGCKPLMDGMCHKALDDCNRFGLSVDFARVRMFGGIGMAISSLITGTLLDHVKCVMPRGFPDELSLVVISLLSGVVFVTILICYVPDAESCSEAKLFEAALKVMKALDVLVLLLVQFLSQFAINLTRSYENLYVLFLGGSKSLGAVASFLFYCSDVMMMYFSPIICAALGSMEMTVAVSLYITGIRCFAYAFADSPYLALSNSYMNGFTSGLQLPTMNKLIKSSADAGLTNSFVSLLVTVGKIGGSVASKVGGNLSDSYGYRTIYIIATIVFLSNAVIYTIFRLIVRFIPSRLLSTYGQRRPSITIGKTDPERVPMLDESKPSRVP